MPIFSKLFEMLPDAEQLLSLEPEELAGPLLVSLKDFNQINPENIIRYDDMSQEIKEESLRGKSNLNYPQDCSAGVLYALMEAWQWLEREGFVARRPTNLPRGAGLSSTNTYFVTRRGKKIETLEDYESYRKADLLRKHQLHPIIADKVWRIFAQGSYGTAVLEAFKQVEIAVRKVGGYADTDYGTNLMGKAFHTDNGNLTDENQQDAEKQACLLLFSGAIGYYKNPSSHREVEFNPEEAAEIIILASHLLRIVNTRAGRTSNPPN